MRDIKFRGKTLENFSNDNTNIVIPKEKWIYGGITYDTDRIWINTPYYGQIIVNKETIGQYTGLHDKNGKEIYEGDIVQWAGIKMEIFWGEDIGIGYGFCWRPCGDNSGYHESMTGFIDEYEVIGNIYDNPELLEREEDDE